MRNPAGWKSAIQQIGNPRYPQIHDTLIMSPSELQEIRSSPLFAGLNDAQLGCLDGGQVIAAPVGTVLASEGERTGFFHVILEGEVRATRTYDRQSILLGVNKAGNYLGETMLLLDMPWVATCRVSKPGRLFRLNEESFWRMLTSCQTVAREIFRSAANRMRNLEGYSQQRSEEHTSELQCHRSGGR